MDELADSAVNIKGRIRTWPGKQAEAGREYLRRVKKAFDQEGIEIPFPQRSIHLDEAGKPIMVRLIDSAAPPPARGDD